MSAPQGSETGPLAVKSYRDQRDPAKGPVTVLKYENAAGRLQQGIRFFDVNVS